MSEAFSGDCTASGVRGYSKQAIGETMFKLTIQSKEYTRTFELTKLELDNYFVGDGYEVLSLYVEENFVYSDVEELPTFIDDYVSFLCSGLLSTLHFSGVSAICLDTLRLTNRLDQLQDNYIILEI